MKLKIEKINAKGHNDVLVKWNWEAEYHTVDTPNEYQEIVNEVHRFFGIEPMSVNDHRHLLYNVGRNFNHSVELVIDENQH